MNSEYEVAVVGLGYVGMTLAITLASKGARILGIEPRASVRNQLNSRNLPFFEPGLDKVLAALPESQLVIVDRVPDEVPRTVIVCVGTPTTEGSTQPDLSQLCAALVALAPKLTDDSLLVLRSTVPVGTTRALAIDALGRQNALTAFCPERTIQGKAYEELTGLPQIIGGSSPEATRRGAELFRLLTETIVEVSSIEAAETIKLLCNAHTDMLYAFGNQTALIAEALGLDARELLASANQQYPRPRLHQPGFVGGSCLTKDPYLLTYSLRDHAVSPDLSLSARTLNEKMPGHVADRVLQAMKEAGDPAQSTVLILGLAYKGCPETDDIRGSAATEIIAALRGQVGTILAHDPVVCETVCRGVGAEPAELSAGLARADAVIILTDHPVYAGIDQKQFKVGQIVMDVWGSQRVLDESAVVYLELGRA